MEGEIATLKESVYSFAIQHTDEVTSALQQLIPEMFRVLLRQLGDFHEGGDYVDHQQHSQKDLITVL